MNVHELVAMMAAANASDDPTQAIAEAMASLTDDLPGLAETLSYLPGTGGNARQAFFRSPDLSLSLIHI